MQAAAASVAVARCKNKAPTVIFFSNPVEVPVHGSAVCSNYYDESFPTQSPNSCTTGCTSVCTHHSHGLRVEHLLRGECGEVSQVGQNVHCRHDGQRDDDGTRKVSAETSKYQHQVWTQRKQRVKSSPATLTCKRRSFPR